MIYYLLFFIAYIIPTQAGNIIFSSPTPGTKISAGNAQIVSWDITVDSGDLTLESASGNSVSPKLLTSGLDGKSFTWIPTESDLSPFAGAATVLRLLDRKDSARIGVSGTFNVDSPQKALAPASSSTPVVVVLTPPAPQPTPIIINTIITTNPPPSTTSPIPTPTVTSSPPKFSTPDPTSTSTPTTSNEPTTLISSTVSSSPTTNILPNDSQTPTIASSYSTLTSSDPSTNSNYLVITVAASNSNPQPTTTSTDPPTTPPLTTPTKAAIAVASSFSFLFLLIVVFYFGRRNAKNHTLSEIQTQNNVQYFLRRAISRPRILKPELDSESNEILELAAIKEKKFFEIEGRGLPGRRRSVAELQGGWEGAELEDTSKRGVLGSP